MISSGTSFHNLGPKLVIVSVPKCMYISIRYMCSTPKVVIFIFLNSKNLIHYFRGEAVFYFKDFCS